MQSDTQEHPVLSPRKRRRFFVWTGRLLVGIVLLFFLLLVLIHLPPVQQWGIQKITRAISRNLDTRVTMTGFTLSPISDLTLKEIYIGSPDSPGDTLIYAERLSVDYKRIWDLLKRQFTITDLSIKNGSLHIHRLSDANLTNLDLALLRLLPPRDTTKPNFVLDLQGLRASKLRVSIDDEYNGSLINMIFQHADIDLDTLDIQNNYLSIKDLDLDEPSIDVINRVVAPDTVFAPGGNTKSWKFDVSHFHLKDGKFSTNNQGKAIQYYPDLQGIDYSHMHLDDVDIELDSLFIRGWDFKGKNINIHLHHENGFEIRKLAAQRAAVSKDGIIIDALDLVTPRSAIQNSIALNFDGFRDFRSFTDSVRLDIPAADMIVYIPDLLALAPGLQRVDFFADNRDKNITLQGKVNGHINHLSISGMNASIGGLRMLGDFKSSGLAVNGQQEIRLDLKSSSINAIALKGLFPKMKLPEEFDRIGQVNFTGQFEGSPKDFHAFGTFHTSLGGVTLDMNLNTLEGLAKGTYSGILGLQDFDLGTLTGNADLGRVTMSGQVTEGKGLTSSSMSADLNGQLNALHFKGYTYHHANIEGRLTGKLFEGSMEINDPNIDMQFDGIVDFRDSLTRLDFVSRIDSIHFWELGLAKKQMDLDGYVEVNLKGDNLNTLNGTVKGQQISFAVMEDQYSLDSILLLAAVDPRTMERRYTIASEILSGHVSGIFNPSTLPGAVQAYLHEKYPGTFDAPAKAIVRTEEQQITWDLSIHDSRNWFDLAGVKDLNISDAHTSGTLNLGTHQATGTIDLPELHYGGVNVYGSTIAFEEDNGIAGIDLEVIAADVKESFFFEDVLVTGTATDDSVKLRFRTDDLADIIDEIDLDVVANAEAGTWNIEFSPRRLKMIGTDWKVPAGNRVEIRKNYFNLEDFELISGDQRILIDDIDHKGIDAFIDGFDISYLNTIWLNEKFDFFGRYSMDLEIDNLYNIQHLQCSLHIPELKVNGVPYGNWEVNASMKEPRDSVRIDIAMENNETRLTGEGAYLPPIKSIPKNQQNYLRLAVHTTDFPLDFIEFLIGSNIRDTEGSVDMDLSLKGKTNKLDPNGVGRVFNGSTTIDYLGAAYSFHDQKFRITENLIDLSGVKLYDVQGNTAIVEGGITHRYLRNLGLNATVTSAKILGLDVTAEENNVFYGKGIGSVFARFSGTVANPVMEIQTTTAQGTHIYIPLSGAAGSSDRDFVVFLENGLLPVTTTTQINLGGIDLRMYMTITDEAIIELIFDENTGEVLRGQGTGDIQMAMTRTGNFTMYGNFNISKGDYLFTNFGFIRKPFEIKEGGSVQWNGDPYDATLNVQAKYKGLTAPVQTLIQEYLTGASQEVLDQAKDRTEVDMTMILTGSLLSPDIAFDISFPNLTGEIKGYTDSKIASLNANENAMFEQVMGLLIMRSFLPSSNIGTAEYSKAINNTLSELISATLSNYLGGLFRNIIPEGEFLSGIDLQVGLDIPITSNTILDESGNLQDQSATEVEVNLPLEFFNDRLSVNVGGNYVTGASLVSASEYFAGDVTFEYWITPDRRLKIRAYNRNTLTVEGRKNKVGAGIAYRREYDSFGEFLGKKKKE